MTRKKRGSGELALAALICAAILIARIPREIWISLGVLAIAFYGYKLYRSEHSKVSKPERPTLRSVGSDTWTPGVAKRDLPTPASRSSAPKDEPVRVYQAQAERSSFFRVPASPKGFGRAGWVPVGETATVAGITIPGGLLYVGTLLETPSGTNDPSLIDPSLPVALYGNYTVRQMDYWPSYSTISSTARRAYLDWLAGGRQDPAADIGFIFLFFYGLERRAIIDSTQDQAGKAEWPILAAELRRLLGIYGGKSGSFRTYGGSLLDWLSLAEQPEKAYLKPLPAFVRTGELPLYLRVALGQAALDGVPVPPELALAWAKLDPTISLRTPASRCGKEFDALFGREYRNEFGEGMRLPKNRTKLKLVYRPASSGFRGYHEPQLTFGETPDVTALTAPVKQLQQVVEKATTALEPFSRYLGRNPEGRTALEGLLLLPVTLWPADRREAVTVLRAELSEGTTILTCRELLERIGATADLNRDRAHALARALDSEGIGIEPDVLEGAKVPKPDDSVVLFPVEPGDNTSRVTPAYQAAALTIQLATAVAGADGSFVDQEVDHIRGQVESWSHLTPTQIRRLTAHIRLLTVAPVSLAALRKKLEPLGTPAKEAIAQFMATVAQSDGMVSPAEVRMLEKVYKVLGVDPERVFTDVHAAASGTTPAPAVGAKHSQGFKLNPARVAALQRDTDAVSALLTGIFQEETAIAPTPVHSESEADEDVATARAGVLGLDEAHSALARLLLSRPEWTMDEVKDAAADLDLMLAGAIETLNEAAFDSHNLPFFEGDDPVIVNPELVEKLAA